MNIRISEKAVLYRINKLHNHENNTTIGACIRKERMAQGLKQESVCKDICSVSYYSRIESNKIIPSNWYISKIFKKLNKPVPKNLTHEGNKHNKEIINNFLTAIEYKNRKLIEEEYQKIKKLSDIYLELYEFVYYINHNKIDDLEPIIQKLHAQQIHFENEELLLYLENLATYHICKQNYIKAEKNLILALKLINKFNYIQPLVLYKYAWVQGKLNNDLKCIEFAEEADKLFTINHNTYRSIQCQMLISIKTSKWFPDKAIQLYEKIMKVTYQNGHENMFKLCKYNLSLLFKKYNYYDEAESAFLELLDLYTDDLHFIFNINIEYIDLLLTLSKFDEAKKCYLEIKTFNFSNARYKFLIKYYDYKLHEKDLNLKIYTYKNEFIPYTVKTNNKTLEVRVRKEYALLLELNNNYQECISEYKKIILLEDEKEMFHLNKEEK